MWNIRIRSHYFEAIKSFFYNYSEHLFKITNYRKIALEPSLFQNEIQFIVFEQLIINYREIFLMIIKYTSKYLIQVYDNLPVGCRHAVFLFVMVMICGSFVTFLDFFPDDIRTSVRSTSGDWLGGFTF